MRKADYSLLAELVRAEIEHARRDAAVLGDNLASFRHAANARLATAQRIARQFVARHASVDGPTFLRACGIE